MERVRHEIIQEVSEPVSPENGPSSKSPGQSALSNLLRRSPPSRSPPDNGSQSSKSGSESESEPDRSQGRLIITSNGLKVDATERTPLFLKQQPTEPSHPDWIGGQSDLEQQDTKRRPSWPKLHGLISWPQKKVSKVTHTLLHPKEWDREAIVQNLVYAPARNFPAAVLGALLNILDALSYGM